MAVITAARMDRDTKVSSLRVGRSLESHLVQPSGTCLHPLHPVPNQDLSFFGPGSYGDEWVDGPAHGSPIIMWFSGLEANVEEQCVLEPEHLGSNPALPNPSYMILDGCLHVSLFPFLPRL